MTLAWIEFDSQLGIWSPLTFWVVIISVILTLGFTVAIFIGGVGDLRYLLRSLGHDQDKSSDADGSKKP